MMPTKGLGLTKQAVNASFTNDLETQLSLEEELQTIAGHSYDFDEELLSISMMHCQTLMLMFLIL